MAPRSTLLLAAMLALGAASLDARPIPPRPRTEQYLWDDAGLLRPEHSARVAGLQKDALERYNSPIVLVTLQRVGDYDSSSVEALARRWFDSWQIGTLGLERGANQGILLLVAVQDRRARIERGGDWGHDWDVRAEAIMKGSILPRFKAGDYSGGVVAGVEELLGVAKAGPHSAPPGAFLERHVRPLCCYTFLDPWPFVIVMGIGLALVLLGLFGPGEGGTLVMAGVALILLAAFSWIIFMVLLVIGGLTGKVRGGGGSSGRGFSGGWSGGGGASGSW